MTNPISTEVARAFLSVRQGAKSLSREWAADKALTPSQAYEVQSLVAAELGPVGGFKFAQRSGQPAIMAPIQRADILVSGAKFPASGSPVGIELEVGFRLNAALPSIDAPDFKELLRACVSPVAVIETVQTRLADLDTVPAVLKLADHQTNGGLIVGDPAKVWDGSPFGTVDAYLTFDDEVVLDGRTNLPFGPAFDCLVALARMVGDHCGGLNAGHIVITGSLNGLPWLPPGTRVRGSIEGIGSVAVDLE
ncbi:2-keto-4-pentenoate hydratase [Sulfitobacter sp. SK011]|uniref:2-keto-4-pentenoate hydratase n=1 Tax=Sulfitobacter sp. SK011 TaxID=1389004 RepID=UPI000E0CB35F|nr:2-keto-4-pentenoate hydratase [Sulfitobacter sp. SK011]AXI43991.1 2-keto-4-pentenoate hydratase [Sulfitobacter sp. SK011]